MKTLPKRANRGKGPERLSTDAAWSMVMEKMVLNRNKRKSRIEKGQPSRRYRKLASIALLIRRGGNSRVLGDIKLTPVDLNPGERKAQIIRDRTYLLLPFAGDKGAKLGQRDAVGAAVIASAKARKRSVGQSPQLSKRVEGAVFSLLNRRRSVMSEESLQESSSVSVVEILSSDEEAEEVQSEKVWCDLDSIKPADLRKMVDEDNNNVPMKM